VRHCGTVSEEQKASNPLSATLLSHMLVTMTRRRGPRQCGGRDLMARPMTNKVKLTLRKARWKPSV